MKLSAFFNVIDTVWTSHSFPGLGMIVVIYVGIAYAANRVVRSRQGSALFYGIYSFAFFFVLAAASVTTFDTLVHEPVLLAMIAALAGAGIEVYRRLAQD